MSKRPVIPAILGAIVLILFVLAATFAVYWTWLVRQ